MKKYILISKNCYKEHYTLYESDSYKFILQKYNLWKSIMPKTYFAIYKIVE